ncbi:MAG: 1-(5-phosphoribosyl)-5-[(5-phosphoribosylamino)methylideneamino]imidazole-4-carboxamide isomerase [Oscillospiraceae bacterium]
MIILPAIDIKDGNCVRLFKGDFSTVEKVADSYMDTAVNFKNNGAKWIHMVDLDGAKKGIPVNNEIFIDVAKNSGLKVELGGGIRNLDTVEYYLQNGISRIILGSAAVKNPDFVKLAVKEFGDRIAVGIDAKEKMVAVEGWIDSSQVDYIELAKRMCDVGIKYIIFTDIGRDGTLDGVNIEQLTELNRAVDANIIASGGVRDINDVIKCQKNKLYGMICGKSIYKGTLNLKDAVQIAENSIG